MWASPSQHQKSIKKVTVQFVKVFCNGTVGTVYLNMSKFGWNGTAGTISQNVKKNIIISSSKIPKK
jgi:hypothetical protein